VVLGYKCLIYKIGVFLSYGLGTLFIVVSTSCIKVWLDLVEEREWILMFESNIECARLTLKDEIVEFKYVSG
jgi:hypothetical protein